MKEYIPPILGYVDEGSKSTRAMMVVIVATGETWGESLGKLQAKLESTTVIRPDSYQESNITPVLFTPLT